MRMLILPVAALALAAFASPAAADCWWHKGETVEKPDRKPQSGRDA